MRAERSTPTGRAGREADMDELLASIRQIIAEEPLSLRDRSNRDRPAAGTAVSAPRPVAGPSPVAVQASVVQPAMMQPTLMQPGVVRTDDAVQPAEPLARMRGIAKAADPVFEELFDAASEPPKPPPSPAPVPTDIACSESHMQAPPPVRPEPEMSLLEAPLAMPVPEPLAKPSGEARAMAEALDALAASLAGNAPPAASVAVEVAEPAPEPESMASAPIVPLLAPDLANEPPVHTADEPSQVVTPAESVPVPELAAPPVETAPAPPPASFEDTIAAMLRPLLREWLDANMPRVVENMMRADVPTAAAPAGAPITAP